MMSRKGIKWFVVLVVAMFCVQAGTVNGFAAEKDVEFNIDFVVVGEDGKSIDPKSVSFMVEGKDSSMTGMNSGFNIGKLITGSYTDKAIRVKYREPWGLTYSLYGEHDNALFQVSGTVGYDVLTASKEKGETACRVTIKLSDMTKVEVTPTVDGVTIEGTTMMFLPVDGLHNSHFEENTSVVGKIQEGEKSKIAYLSTGVYTPIFVSKRGGDLIYYTGDTLTVSDKETQQYRYNQVKSDLTRRTVRTAGQLKNKPYFTVQFYTDTSYTYWDAWNRQLLDVFIDEDVVYAMNFYLMDYPQNRDVGAIEYPFTGDLVLSDTHYFNAIESRVSYDGSYFYLVHSKDLNGNLLSRSDMTKENQYEASYEPFEAKWLGDAEGRIRLIRENTFYHLEYSKELDLGKTYWVELSHRADPTHYGTSLFKLEFRAGVPTFTFEKVTKYPKVEYLKLTGNTDEKWLYALNFKNEGEEPVACELSLVEGERVVRTMDSFTLQPKELATQEVAVMISDFLASPNQKLVFYCDGKVLDEKAFSKYYASDIEGHWAVESITSLLSKGILYTGNGDDLEELGGRFSPNAAITRGEFATILVQYAKTEPDLRLEAPEGSSQKPIGFKDVPRNYRHAEAITLMASSGVITGAEGYFKPESTLTRQEAAVMLKRLLALKKDPSASQDATIDETTLEAFDDASEISGFAKDSMAFCVVNKMMSGTQSGQLKPLGTLSKAEVATILNNLYNMNTDMLTW
ncbi:S-layer homology domain-containing protein [Fusibacter sp. JL298sf-3]